MKIETKYSLGDFVYQISTYKGNVKVPTNCPVCKDEGIVKLNKKDYCCPECRGYTYHTIEGDIKWYVKNEIGCIGKVGVEIYADKYKNKDEIKYMLDITGIGSGTLWEENRLFLTIEEAQAECDKRNKENNQIKS